MRSIRVSSFSFCAALSLATVGGCVVSPPLPPDGDPLPAEAFELTRADVGALLVIDRSGSMESALAPDRAGGPTRWQALTDALATTSLAASDVRFGAHVFPDELLPEGEDPERFCTVTEGSLAVPPSLGGLSDIAEHLRAGPAPRGGTPTAAAIRAATAFLDGGASARWALLLVTDGAPNCAADIPLDRCVCSTDASECAGAGSLLCVDDDGTVAAIADAAAAGVPTVVIGFSDPSRPELDGVLATLAEAGRPVMDGARSRRHAVASESDLYDALEEASRSLSSCTYLVPAGVTSSISLEIDGAPIAPSVVDGWAPSELWADAITLHGDACDAAAGRTVSARLTVE